MSEDTSVPVVKMGKFAASRAIVSESWGLIKRNNSLIYFPIVSFLCAIVAFAIMLISYYAIVLGHGFSYNNFINATYNPNSPTSTSQLVNYGCMFVYLIVITFIANFFEAGLIVATQADIEGRKITFQEGMAEATRMIGKIFVWSVISSTVVLLLRIISDKSKLLGKIISAVLGVAWSLATFFSLPVLVLDHASIRDSFKQSETLIKNTFGEMIIGRIELSAYFIVFIFVFFVPVVIIGSIFSSFTVWIVLAIIMFLFIVGVTLVASVMKSIYNLVLFNYAKTGVAPAGFSPDLIQYTISGK